MPDVSTIHVNQPLTNLAVGYPSTGFIAPRLVAEVPVQKRSDLYYIFDAARESVRQSNDRREPGAEANEVDFAMTSGSYICEGHALSAVVPDEEVENADAPIKPLADKTELLTSKLYVNMEIDLAAKLAAGVTQTSDPTNEWDDTSAGDPFADIDLAINTIEDAIGITPNVMSMDTKVWRALRKHPDIIDRVKYGGNNTNPAQIGPEAVAALFDLEEIIIGASMKNTAVKGQNSSISRIWGTDVYVGYRPNGPGLKVPAGAYRFVWAPFSGAQGGFAVKTWREEKRSADMVEVSKSYVHKLTLAAAWYRLRNRLT